MLIVHLLVCYAHVNLCHVFSASWCRWLAAVSACGSYWTFCLPSFNKTESAVFKPWMLYFQRISVEFILAE